LGLQPEEESKGKNLESIVSYCGVVKIQEAYDRLVSATLFITIYSTQYELLNTQYSLHPYNQSAVYTFLVLRFISTFYIYFCKNKSYA